MSDTTSKVAYHRHCQATVLSANGTGNQNGKTWSVLSQASLPNLPSDWLTHFSGNKDNITEDLCGILEIVNETAFSPKNTTLRFYGNGESDTYTLEPGNPQSYSINIEKYVSQNSGSSGQGESGGSYLIASGWFNPRTGELDSDSTKNTAWYRLYSDGWCEQGCWLRMAEGWDGFQDQLWSRDDCDFGGNSDGGYRTKSKIKFYKKYKDTKYLVTFGTDGGNSSERSWDLCYSATDMDVNGFHVQIGYCKAADMKWKGLAWKTAGFIEGASGQGTSGVNGNGSGSTVSFTQTLTSGTEIGTITIDGTSQKIYAPTQTSSGSTPSVTIMSNPIGTIIQFGGNGALPEGYLLCDGSEVSQTDYSELYSVIGNTYGTASSGKFKLPLLTDRRYLQGNTTSGTYVDAGLPNITGGLSELRKYKSENLVKSGAFETSSYVSNKTMTTGATTGDTGVNIVFDASKSNAIYGKSNTVTPKSMTIKYLICAKKVGDSSFDPTKFHTVFFDPCESTSIEFTTKSLYEGSKYGKLPNYTLNGESKNDWYLNGTKITSTDTFNSIDDITLTTTQA